MRANIYLRSLLLRTYFPLSRFIAKQLSCMKIQHEKVTIQPYNVYNIYINMYIGDNIF